MEVKKSADNHSKTGIIKANKRQNFYVPQNDRNEHGFCKLAVKV